LLGAVLGYLIGAWAGCDWLYPDSNLCGIYGALFTGPLGLATGAVIGWRRSRPQDR
jgi:hypothetical protein